ncbi:alpha/beta fold hydrolase [Streptomyces formicae]|uniref:3-oxoadipate enol-lactone hydrolase/4-carboxymuconolactone decarboxylase n=1 Tax=Streptomyces formicae TaxID=1616117 RepID=A0A291QIE7_9ACTN|nr:alpha/beta hydrolase [Streptomyces formicae]ATL31580.1 3-oxoadipate enol-lactone hydrolase/4-carboxymuconolactone decarboxylase [Streptomyces formicae]
MSHIALPEPAFARTVVRGEGPGLLLAHGAGGSVAANYGPILDELGAGHTVVGVDFPGTGDTPRSTTPLSLDELADQLVAAAVAEGVDTFTLIGYSLGTAVAVRAAVRHPERVTGLVLTAPFARPNARLRLNATHWRDLYASGAHAPLAQFLVPLALGATVLESLPAADVDALVQGTAQSLPEGSAEHADLVTRVEVRDDLARVTVPTLVISTTEDLLVTPDLHREVAAGIPGAELVEIPTGHLPFAERPEEWLKLITAFLGERMR